MERDMQTRALEDAIMHSVITNKPSDTLTNALLSSKS